MEYKDYRIYIMQFGRVFQYLITDREKNLYQDHITLTPSLLNILKHKLHLLPVPYTKDEMETGEQVVLAGAISSVDAMADGERKAIKISRTLNKNKKSKDCLWQAVTGDNGALAYQCLTHPGNIVQMTDGEKPFHDFPTEEGILSPIQFSKA